MADLKFLSTEWVEKTEKILREKITPQSTNNATLSIALTVENLPDKQEKTLVFETDKGNLKTFKLAEAGEIKTEFVLSGDYHSFEKLFKGELDPKAAIMSGALKFKGNMLKALGILPSLEPFLGVLSKIPTSF
ncbi:MAG: SCP2 sterol-binding domain-containing protein [Anaerolineaceae bacterium]|nr:SCP2 sterol-binding domain-containing protein [Anaerolineaceae bacterium]